MGYVHQGMIYALSDTASGVITVGIAYGIVFAVIGFCLIVGRDHK